MKGGKKYQTAKDSFDQAYANVSKYENNQLYPKNTTQDAKLKALADYRDSINTLREAFTKYQVDSLENVTSGVFTERLKGANKEVIDAFNEAGCKIPEGFFMGFEKYRDTQPSEGGTGLLAYQLGGVKHVLLELAKVRPSELLNVYREVLPEETAGQKFVSPDGAISRNFGYEISFKCSEPAARKFISALGMRDSYYCVVRCIKVKNDKQIPPKVSDARFEVKVERKEADNLDAIFGEGFLEPEPEVVAPEVTPEAGQPEAGVAPEVVAPEVEPAAPEAPPEPAVDSSRILYQVLGAEEVIVFVRFDTIMFLPFNELPKP